MSGFENECQTERSKTLARWFAIAILTAMVYRQRHQGVVSMPDAIFWLLLTGGSTVNLFHSLYLYRVSACPLYYKYISVGLDLLYVTILIGYSGFNQSPYFYVYFVLLVSNCIRYGLAMSLYIAVLVNVLYTITLALGPQELQPTVLGGEGLKILAFWGVALYGGAVAARLRRHVHEISAYEDTIAELQAQVRQLQAGAAPTEPASAPPPEPATHLRLLHSEVKGVRTLAPIGFGLLILTVLLTFLAPHVLWFLLYPVLIVGAAAALTTAAAWLLHYLHL